MVRSRTGWCVVISAKFALCIADQRSHRSLTCRRRKLKCDEHPGRCGQCTRSDRECVAASGIVFRHQQNASMNGLEGDEGLGLKGFYAYKNTFNRDNTWVDIPRNGALLTSRGG